MKLSALISIILSPAPGQAAVAELAHLFHRIATVYLRRKSAAGNFNANVLGLPIEDIAWDCIAELFRRDTRGCFTQLTNYYRTIDMKNMSEEELLGMSRRLVFSKVNQELYRQYKEHDPSLHKVLRNLKDAVLKVPGVSLETINDTLCIVFGEEHSSLPAIPPEVLESYLTAIVRTGSEQPAILAQIRVLTDPFPPPSCVVFSNIVGDAQNEIVWVESRGGATQGTSVLCKEVGATESLRTYVTEKTLNFVRNTDINSAQFDAREILADDIDGDGDIEIVMNASHQIGFPGMIVILDGKTGAENAHYLHIGYLSNRGED